MGASSRAAPFALLLGAAFLPPAPGAAEDLNTQQAQAFVQSAKVKEATDPVAAVEDYRHAVAL